MGKPPANSSASRFEKALHHHKMGNLGLAERQYRKIPKSNKHYPRALHYLGVIAHQTGNSEKAVKLISQAIALADQDEEMHSNLGNALSGCNRLTDAKLELERAIDLDPNFFGAYNNLGLVNSKLGDKHAAIQCFEKAHGLNPRSADPLANWANVLEEMKKLSPAREMLERALRLNPDHQGALQSIALVLSNLHRWDEATKFMERALQLQPNNAKGWLNMANISRSLGKMNEAREQILKALKLDPTMAEAHRSLANMGRFQEAEKEISDLENYLQDKNITDNSSMHAHYALGKLLNDIGHYDRAFQEYSAANEIEHQHFDLNALKASIDTTINNFDIPFLSRFSDAGHQSEIPIFVLGMPRTGTTLVEQIIASHPKAAGAGELSHIRNYVEDIGDQFELLEFNKFQEFGNNYIAKITAQAPGSTRVVDKYPFNFLYIGLIKLIFPNARIIHCQRDPRDTCLSIFFTGFEYSNPFYTRLVDIGNYYLQYRRIMRHWEKIFPSDVLNVNYESLVSDQEGESRRIIEYCGLQWNDACLEFHKTERPVDTPSDWQVRQPIYTHSVGRWRNYENYITELLEVLEPELSSPQNAK